MRASVVQVGRELVRVGAAGNGRPSLVELAVLGRPRFASGGLEGGEELAPFDDDFSDSRIFPLSLDHKLDEVDVEPLIERASHGGVGEGRGGGGGDGAKEASSRSEVCSAFLSRLRFEPHVLMVEPNFPVANWRRESTQYLFEKAACETFLPLKHAVCASFALAKTSAAVLTLSGDGMDASVVSSGAFVPQAFFRTEECDAESLVEAANISSLKDPLLPSYKILDPHITKHKEQINNAKIDHNENDHPFVTESFKNYFWNQTAQAVIFPTHSLTHSLTHSVTHSVTQDQDQTEVQPGGLPSELPDGQRLYHLRARLQWHVSSKKADLQARVDVSSRVLKALEKSDILFRSLRTPEIANEKRDVASSVVLAGEWPHRLGPGFESGPGGLSHLLSRRQAEELTSVGVAGDPFGGLPPSLMPQWELGEAEPTPFGWRLLYNPDPVKQWDGGWTGGSIVASLAIFKAVAATAANYQEMGIDSIWQRLAL